MATDTTEITPAKTLFETLATKDVLATADPQMGLTRRPDGQTTPDR
jgi:hypothetical protein